MQLLNLKFKTLHNHPPHLVALLVPDENQAKKKKTIALVISFMFWVSTESTQGFQILMVEVMQLHAGQYYHSTITIQQYFLHDI